MADPVTPSAGADWVAVAVRRVGQEGHRRYAEALADRCDAIAHFAPRAH